MAQRAATFARRPSGSRAAERARSVSDPAGAPVTLDLKPLIAPYKRNRALTIRVERLLHGARLTQGRNNGDRSYSLALDDVEDLEYLPPGASYEAHTLAVRVVSVEGGDGETVAVIDLPIAARAAVSEIAAAAPSATTALPDLDAQALREELATAKASVVGRDMELAETRQLVEEARLARFRRGQAGENRPRQSRFSRLRRSRGAPSNPSPFSAAFLRHRARRDAGHAPSFDRL